MSPRKLSDGDRQEILELYRNTEETTSTLAIRFGVSSSTVSRFLKISLSDLEYEDLIQEKRLARTTRSSGENDPQAELILTPITEVETTELSSSEETNSTLEIMSLETEIIDVSKNPQEENLLKETPTEENPQEENLLRETLIEEHTVNISKPVQKSSQKIEIESDNLLSQLEEENIINYTEIEQERDFDDDDDDLDCVNVLAAMFGEDMDDDDDDEDDDDEDDEIEFVSQKNVNTEQLQVLPLAKAIFPRVCYLVIDRYSELITKPLREFADLGKIPGLETQQQTLPVFDNHRVAKRFCDAKGTHSARKGKVIKVPDGRILQKTSSFLQAKGISRILIDGKIYSLKDS
ncbi:transposase [Geminocystis sp. GBBB08]|uniref:transposase n=1 Tax=Geminocystis sp. GBBB08 TaxID=2604140 RepID=UPI0027E2E935|nr:transposase [Geminocystis sp. GBBB08]